MKLPDDIVKQHSEEAWRSGWAGASMKFADEVKHRNECNRFGRMIGEALKQREDLANRLAALLGHYVQLVNSGDAGNRDPEQEHCVIAARRALAEYRDAGPRSGERNGKP